jgi:hypothetical protein
MRYDFCVPKDANDAKTEIVDVYDDDTPTLVAPFDLASYARATEGWEDSGAQSDPRSGIRRTMPTFPHEIGALPGEPAEDAILRALGGGSRVLFVVASEEELARLALDREHYLVLAFVDGERSVAAIEDECTLPRSATLRAIEELLLLAIVA